MLLVGRDGRWLLALQLTSKDHDGYPGARAAGAGGSTSAPATGTASGRPSEVRVDRVMRVDPKAVRREGAVLSRHGSTTVARAVADLHR